MLLPSSSHGTLPKVKPTSFQWDAAPCCKTRQGKMHNCTNDLIKDMLIAVSNRKGRTGTAAGDVAFPKGKENLASILKRYKRRLSNKPVGTHAGIGLRKIYASAP